MSCQCLLKPWDMLLLAALINVPRAFLCAFRVLLLSVMSKFRPGVVNGLPRFHPSNANMMHHLPHYEITRSIHISRLSGDGLQRWHLVYPSHRHSCSGTCRIYQAQGWTGAHVGAVFDDVTRI